MSDNENFHEAVDATALELAVTNALGLELDMRQRSLVGDLGRMFADRDRRREDFLNNHVLRKTYQAEHSYAVGSPGPQTGPGSLILPLVSLQFTKAAAHSSIDMHVIHGGVIDTTTGVQRTASVDVLFSDLAGTLLQTETLVAAAACGPSPGGGVVTGCQVSGRRVSPVGTGLDAGIYVATLRVNIAASAIWTPFAATQLILTETQ